LLAGTVLAMMRGPPQGELVNDSQHDGIAFHLASTVTATVLRALALPVTGVALVALGTACGASGKAAQKPTPIEAKPYEAGSFAEGEPILAEAIAKYSDAKVLRAYMDTGTSEWRVRRNPNGDIKSRHFDVVLFLETTAPYNGVDAGTCYQARCEVQEDENGGDWTKPTLACGPLVTEDNPASGSANVVTCASVEGLAKGIEASASE
jgi:hypothetical protein